MYSPVVPLCLNGDTCTYLSARVVRPHLFVRSIHRQGEQKPRRGFSSNRGARESVEHKTSQLLRFCRAGGDRPWPAKAMDAKFFVCRISIRPGFLRCRFRDICLSPTKGRPVASNAKNRPGNSSRRNGSRFSEPVVEPRATTNPLANTRTGTSSRSDQGCFASSLLVMNICEIPHQS